jgi:hypothetical protein
LDRLPCRECDWQRGCVARIVAIVVVGKWMNRK